MRASTFAVALAFVLPLTATRAQLAEVQPGARVRLTASSLAGRMTGTVATRGRDSLTVLRNGSSPVSIAIGDVRSIEISEGKSRLDGAQRGAIIGGVVLGALSAAFAAGPQPNCDAADAECLRFDWSQVPGAILAGAAYGAGIGAWVGRERWQTLSVNVPATVAVRRMGGGRVGVGASMRF